MSGVVVERAGERDRASMLALVAESGLPTDGLADHVESAYVARRGGRVVGTAAFEVHEDGWLLRSVAVAQSERGSGVGRLLVERALADARAGNAPAVYLLTTTAERYFPRFGFAVIARADVPPSVRASVEFTSACPASAIAMRRRLR